MMKKILLFFSLLCIASFSFTQNTDKSKEDKELQNDVQNLDGKLTNQIERVDVQNKRIDVLDTRATKIEKDLEGYEFPLKYWKGISLALLVFVGSSLYAFLGWLPKRAKELADEQLKDILKTKRDIITEIIDDYDLDRKVKENNPINLITHHGNTSEIKKILETHNFIVHFHSNKDLNHIKVPDNKGVLLLVDEEKEWGDTDIKNFIEKSKHKLVFYFGPSRINIDREKKPYFSAANAKTQLVGNLMNMIKYN